MRRMIIFLLAIAVISLGQISAMPKAEAATVRVQAYDSGVYAMTEKLKAKGVYTKLADKYHDDATDCEQYVMALNANNDALLGYAVNGSGCIADFGIMYTPGKDALAKRLLYIICGELGMTEEEIDRAWRDMKDSNGRPIYSAKAKRMFDIVWRGDGRASIITVMAFVNQ